MEHDHVDSSRTPASEARTEIRLEIDAALLEQIRAYARRERIDENEAVRDALDAYFRSGGKTAMPRFRYEHDCY